VKKLAFLVIATLAVLSSCNREKPYIISGTFDIPDSLNYGDTVIAREPLDGMYVYMLNLDGDPIDSVLVENDTFTFEGTVPAKDSYFAYIACDYSYGIIAIEPGEYSMTIGEEIIAYGSPTNDAINDIDAKLTEIEQGVYDKLMVAMEATDGTAPSDSLLMPFYMEFNEKYAALMDSICDANKKNLIGVYAANIMTSSASTVEELEQMLEEFDDYVKNSPLMDARRDYLRGANSRFDYQGLVGDEETEE